MPRNYFTDEEINILKNNPYVLKVSKANVVFTEEFKKYFIAQYNYGIQPRDIFRSININPEILGNRRIGTITRRFKDQSVRPEGFSRKTNSSKGNSERKRFLSFHLIMIELNIIKNIVKS